VALEVAGSTPAGHPNPPGAPGAVWPSTLVGVIDGARPRPYLKTAFRPRSVHEFRNYEKSVFT
jgi:hypothetical protein